MEHHLNLYYAEILNGANVFLQFQFFSYLLQYPFEGSPLFPYWTSPLVSVNFEEYKLSSMSRMLARSDFEKISFLSISQEVELLSNVVYLFLIWEAFKKNYGKLHNLGGAMSNSIIEKIQFIVISIIVKMKASLINCSNNKQ